jgi:hypothetical protein
LEAATIVPFPQSDEETLRSDIDTDNFLESANSDKQRSALPRPAIKCLRRAHSAQFAGNASISGLPVDRRIFDAAIDAVPHARSDALQPFRD